MTDRLTIINDALKGTGNNPVNVEYDGSEEWIAADAAYRRSVGFLLARHRWNFAAATSDLAAQLTPTPSELYHDGYAFILPSDCLHVETVYYKNRPLSEYEIIGRNVCCAYETELSVKYVAIPSPDKFPPLWAELLTMKVQAHLMRSLNEDTENARAMDRDVEVLLSEARPLSDQEEPRRAYLNSRSARRRRAGAYR